MRSSFGIALSSLILLSGCDIVTIGSGPTLNGSGITKEESREVPAFRGVEVSSSFEATITLGPKPSVTLFVDDNLLPIVETEVKAGVLSIRYASGNRITTKGPQKVMIVTEALDSVASNGASKVSATVGETKAFKVEADGASTVEIKGISTDSLMVEGSGAVRIDLVGRAKQLILNLSGASKVVTTEGSYESAKVDISGASQAELMVSGSIVGSVSDASTLSVKGEPKSRSVQASGASSVSY